jgi:hypothetical protein
MKPYQSIWLLCFALLPMTGLGATAGDLPFEVASSLPREVTQRLPTPTLDGFVLSAHLNPYYLQGDFDGDGRRDTALLIKHKASGKLGIAIFQSNRPEPFVLGAGISVGNGGDNFTWMNAWLVQSRGPVGRGADRTAPPTLKGDALLVIQVEAASALLYWSGSKYEWYQQGD